MARKQKPLKAALRSEVAQEYRKTTKFVQTTDDWHPTFQDGTVRGSVSINPMPRKEGEYWGRVCFWGADDFGLERDWDFGTDLAAAHEWFEHWSSWLSGLTMAEIDSLRSLDFINA